ncbi:VOC family protein [Pseudoflavitalea sp. G-6-1-2]|uniref:VOC family protein n=1 Tax=Pseudoflavitalea sp. G-6-1-2 TaxID=2728841 RepID=UPI001469CE10|nr:VOC family protein [Pseudoflavitalea sp. G-6-1-2]NML21411.1 VOC family protein [Pseudoflavitalea sp. G-6-1-2]
MQKIIPHLWYDKEAKEAVAFYTSIFPESKVLHSIVLRDTPSGDCDVIGFTLWNQEFMAISAGPYFKLNPSISFIVNFDPLFFSGSPDKEKAAGDKLEEIWNKLSDGGTALMPLNEYPFSKKYGWIQDKYGLSWQLMLGKPDGDPRPAIVPAFMFIKENYGRADEAIDYYLAAFKNSKDGFRVRYPAGTPNEKENAVMYSDFMLGNHWFALMENNYEHNFNFNEAVSFIINCEDQQEIDYYWEKLSKVPESEQCGWVKDQFGVSWQISYAAMEQAFATGSQEQIDRLTKAFMPMKKLDVEKLKAAM